MLDKNASLSGRMNDVQILKESLTKKGRTDTTLNTGSLARAAQTATNSDSI